jgi:YggT family protein
MPIAFWIVYRGIHLLIMLIFAATVLSWFRPDPRNPIVRLLNGIVDPLLHPIRAILPGTGGMDFSPMIAVIILLLLQNLLTGGLAH